MPFVTAALIGGGASIVGGLLSGSASKSAANKQAQAAREASQVTKQMYDQTRSDLMPWQQGGNVALSELLYRMGLSPRGQTSAPEAPNRERFYKRGPSTFQNTPSLDPRQPASQKETPGEMFFDEDAYKSAIAGYDTQMRDYQNSLNAASGDPEYGSLMDTFGLEDFQESPAYQFNLQQGMEAINKSAAAKGKYYAPATLQDIGKYSQGLASNEFQNAFSNYNTGQNNIWNRLMGVSNSGQNAATQTGQFGSAAAGQIGENTIGAGNASAAGTVGAANAITGGIGDAYNAYLMSQVLGQRQAPTYGGYMPNGG